MWLGVEGVSVSRSGMLFKVMREAAAVVRMSHVGRRALPPNRRDDKPLSVPFAF